MIQSMTAFSRKTLQGDFGVITWEIRAVNHRYLELNCRIPESMREVELLCREKAQKALVRGKVECKLRFESNAKINNEIEVDESYAKQVIQAGEKIMALSDNLQPMQTLKVLQWPGVIHVTEQDMSSIHKQVLALLDETLEDFKAMRTREGESLAQTIEQRLQGIEAEIENVKKVFPEVLGNQRQKLVDCFNDAKVELDPARLEQEMVMLAQKIDVTEEVDRLQTHIKEARRILQNPEPAGRRLDFLMQEFNREANTLGSKSTHTDCTKAAIELKVLIEQMREQVQNIL